ncbi:MAG: ABC transporter ATP-binding protein/permease [Clostridia bacterium]|nr:ABC transporter ATP-binding protein/permease [Clostridia bacterium]
MKKLFRYMKPYRLLAVISPIIMAGEVIGDLCLPFLMSFLVNYGVMGEDIYDPEKGSAIALSLLNFFGIDPAEKMKVIIGFGLMMLLVTLIGGFFGTMCAWTAASASQGFGNDLRRDAFGKVMSLSIEQTDKFTTGSLVTRMTNDISMVVEFVEAIIRHFVRAPAFFIGGTIMLLELNLSFGAVLLCALPVLVVLLTAIILKAVPLFSVVQEKLDRVNAVVQENVGGARVVKAYSREEYECERFDKANREMRDTSLRVSLLIAFTSPVLTMIMALATAAVIFIGGRQVAIGNSGMTVGAIMAGTSYISQVLSSVMMLTFIFQTVSRAGASAKRINEVLESVPVIADGAAEGNPDSETVVEFRNVSFSYPGTVGREVLKDINLTVKRGETLAVIGETGSGKTSLIQMIPRFYDCTSGSVLVDGTDVRNYRLSSLRKKIGYVMQKTELFSDTAGNNIKWGKPDASDAEVKEAADTAQAAEFVNSLPEGYDGFIAEKGASLSGGQKQRMSIARALVRRPEILILDDSTSALDLATEAKLQKALMTPRS